MNQRRSFVVLTAMAFGFAFLYIPILSMVVYSFNHSKLVTVWDAANSPTIKWYVALLGDTQVLEAARLSLKIAAMNATGAVILGTLAGLALARFGRFKGRTLLTGLTTAPMVMPEVITGLAMLLLFVAMQSLVGWPEGRGVTTITIAHITFSMAYVTVVIQSRLLTLDESLEEAAMDLGATPLKAFALAHHFSGHSFRLAARFHLVLGRSRHHQLCVWPRFHYLAAAHLLESASRGESIHQRAGYRDGVAGGGMYCFRWYLDAASGKAPATRYAVGVGGEPGG